jgi:hypothetical protein
MVQESDPDRPFYFLIRLVRRLLESDLTLDKLGELLYQAPNNTVTHAMGRILKNELKHVSSLPKLR